MPAGLFLRPADYKSVLYQLSYASTHFFTTTQKETLYAFPEKWSGKRGLEPATYSLEGCRSSQLSYSRDKTSDNAPVVSCIYW